MSIYKQSKRKYQINDNYFSNGSLQSIYFAGLLAADGNIGKHSSIRIGLQRQDRYILELFLEEMGANYPIKDNLEKEKFLSSRVEIASKKIQKDLLELYNIKPKKSLILTPPNIFDKIEVDSFISGYIDGDGSIFIGTPRNNTSQGVLSISILGTLEMLTWIQNRFKEILDLENVGSLKKKRKDSKNTYSLVVSNRMARNLFIHYFNIPVKKLNRKWKTEYLEYSKNFINQRHIKQNH